MTPQQRKQIREKHIFMGSREFKKYGAGEVEKIQIETEKQAKIELIKEIEKLTFKDEVNDIEFSRGYNFAKEQIQNKLNELEQELK